MVKIPTYTDEFKKQSVVTDAYSGFSGGEMQVAKKTGAVEAGRAINIAAHHFRKIEKAKEVKDNKLWLDGKLIKMLHYAGGDVFPKFDFTKHFTK